MNKPSGEAPFFSRAGRWLAKLVLRLESNKVYAAQPEKREPEFRRALDAGEMPTLRQFPFETDYSPPFTYDPVSRKQRKRFAIYPEAL